MIMVKVTTKRKNPGWAKKRLKKAVESTRDECAVGFPKGEGLGNPHYTTKSAGEKETAGPSILEVAVWNNYGTDKLPARPFMEIATAAISKEWKAMQAQIMKKAKRTGKAVDVKAVLELAGVMGEDKIKEAIGNGDFEANAPATIKKKGSSKPLIDTGALKGAATYVIRGKST